MFIGHFGLGLAAKKINNKPSLGTYFIAVQFLDLLWPMLLIRGIEKVEIQPGNTELTPLNFTYYPYSHSLFMAAVWGVLLGLFYFLVAKDGRTSIFLGCLVLSHWVLDFFTHRPDLPLSPWSDQKFGLGLWNYPVASLIIESIIFIGGAILYMSSTKPKNNSGRISLWVFVIFMLAVFFMNAFGEPPHAVSSIALLGLSQLLLVAWGYWIDANREPARGMSIIPPFEGKIQGK